MTVATEVSYEKPMQCRGRGDGSYDARGALFNMSMILVAEIGYLLNIGASDSDMGQNIVTKDCTDRRGRRQQFPPIDIQMDPNFIQIQDRSGKYVYGIHGGIDPAIQVSPNHKISASWDFAALNPTP